MTTVRWGRAAIDAPSQSPRIQWGLATLEGTASQRPRLRWGGAAVDGVAAVVVAPIPNRSNVEPESTLTITAALQDGGTADSWTWRPVSGPAVGITGTGPTVQLVAPSHIDGTTVVLGVQAAVGSTKSSEVTITLNVLPQTEWWWIGSGWIPRTETWTDPGAPPVEIPTTPVVTDPPEYGAGIYGAGIYGK